ncbi:MAG: LamG domain-containing protein [Candidatus Omnitrophica bacterium]|nr:LamG domain-containing protein [Candidatus Omnitrophota bacterium]
MRNKLSVNGLRKVLLVILILSVIYVQYGLAGTENFARAENLLKNSSFLKSTNPGFPDYWAGQSGWRPKAHQLVGSGFISGTKSMEISNLDGHSTSFFSSNYGWSPGAPGTVYTFAVYLKSNPAGLSALIGSDSLKTKKVMVTSKWKRYIISAPLKSVGGYAGNFLIITITLPNGQKTGSLFINYPVLVRGKEAALPDSPLIHKTQSSSVVKTENKETILKNLKKYLIGQWDTGKTDGKDKNGNVIIKDESNNGNNGVVFGTPSWIYTKYGSTLYFNGKTYISIPYSSSLDGKKDALSFELVLKPNSGKTMNIFEKGMQWGGYALRINYGHFVPIISSWKFASGPTVMPIAQDIVVTFKKPIVEFYLNGKLTDKSTIDYSIDPQAGQMHIMIGGFDLWNKKEGYHPVPGFKGWIKLIRIYDAALTPEEVMFLHERLLVIK